MLFFQVDNAFMSENWQQQLTKCIKSKGDLQKQFQTTDAVSLFSEQASQQFRLKIPVSFLNEKTTTASDPLLLQVMPRQEETLAVDGFKIDPVGDISAMATPGLIHKYKNRALFIVTGACAIHCRYCFRRHFPYSDAQINNENWEPAFQYLREHKEITEIILSGGDPLMISDEKLTHLVNRLEQIQHLRRLRIHSRIPSVLPERINNHFIELLQNSRFNVSLVTHINHPNEINENNQTIFKMLQTTSIQLLNQSVLLSGVNNNANILIDLSEKLYETGVLPYYLHLLDPVQGAAHFYVKEADAKLFMDEMTNSLPGYLVPKLVKEISGEQAKTRIL